MSTDPTQLPDEVREAIIHAYAQWWDKAPDGTPHGNIIDYICAALVPLWPKPTQPSADVQRVAEEICDAIKPKAHPYDNDKIIAAILAREFGEPRTYRMANGSIVTGPRAVELLEFEEQRLRKAYDEIAELKQRICVDTPQMLALNAELLDQRDRAEAERNHFEATVNDKNALIHTLRSMLREAGFPERIKVGEDFHGNEDFMPVRVEAQLKDCIAERDQLRAEVERLKTQAERWEVALRDSDQRVEHNAKTVSDLRSQLAAAIELLREIRDGEVNEADEADKFLRDHTPSELSRIRAQLAVAQETLDWAETLLCNAKPEDHCKQQEWDELVRKWRDQKHAARKEGTRHA